MVVQEIGGKREEQEQLNADDLSTGSKSHLVDGASGKEGNGKKEGEIWNGYGNNKYWNTGMKQ